MGNWARIIGNKEYDIGVISPDKGFRLAYGRECTAYHMTVPSYPPKGLNPSCRIWVRELSSKDYTPMASSSYTVTTTTTSSSSSEDEVKWRTDVIHSSEEAMQMLEAATDYLKGKKK